MFRYTLFQEKIDRLDEVGAKELLKSVADKVPSLILDIMDRISRDDEPSSPDPEEGSWPDWCICQNCREMPSDASRVCCGMRPDLCTSCIPVRTLRMSTFLTKTLIK